MFQRIIYDERFPININILNIKKYPVHYHHDLEIIYVIQGKVLLKNMCHSYELNKGDVFTNSGNEIHALSSLTEDNMVAIIQVSNLFFTRYFPKLIEACFMTFYVEDKNKDKLKTLQKQILELLLLYLTKNFNYLSDCIDKMISIVELLEAEFNLFAFKKDRVVAFKNDDSLAIERISKIINFVYKNYSHKISLSDLAEKMHLSKYYLSHLIKDYMGINFRDFLSFARVEQSEKLLLDTNQKINVIAKNVGFSTTAYYIKYFNKWYGDSPENYRETHKNLILSETNLGKFTYIPVHESIVSLKANLSFLNSQDKNLQLVEKNFYSLVVDHEHLSNFDFRNRLNYVIFLEITPIDVSSLGPNIFNLLNKIYSNHIVICLDNEDKSSQYVNFQHQLKSLGYKVIFNNISLNHINSYIFNTTTFAAHLLSNILNDDKSIFSIQLRDNMKPNNSDYASNAQKSCFNYKWVEKPIYNVLKFLSYLDNLFLYRFNKNIYISTNYTPIEPYYFIIMLNYDKSWYNKVSKNSSLYETFELVNNYKDEIYTNLRLNLPKGEYLITKFIMSEFESLISYDEVISVLESTKNLYSPINLVNTLPNSTMEIKHINDSLDLNSLISGASIQFYSIEMLKPAY